MTELTQGIFEVIKKLVGGSSVTLALVYTFGHIFIAMTTTYFITGSTLELAALNALVEPCINGVWFYVLHSIWRKLQTPKTQWFTAVQTYVLFNKIYFNYIDAISEIIKKNMKVLNIKIFLFQLKLFFRLMSHDQVLYIFKKQYSKGKVVSQG